MTEEKYTMVKGVLASQKSTLHFTEEDEKLILKLFDAYWKKRKGELRGDPAVLAASVLWRYSSDNHLWEYDKNWTQKSLAELFNVRGKTIGNTASEIRNLLKIDYFDDRFCRKSVAENNPMRSMAVLPNGFILPKEIALEKGLPFSPLKKDKADYYYDGCDWLEAGENKKAIYCFKKALEMDDEYVEAWNGLGTVYFLDNLDKAKEYFQKAYELTKKQFKNKWPKEINWGILENRQYLRSIQYLGLILWREEKNSEALELFRLLLKLNQNDNQGARYLVAAVYAGLTWEQMEEYEEDGEKEEKLLEEQNAKHKFLE